ncbi:hypothetical protein D3C87_1839690 [compost metagenome]
MSVLSIGSALKKSRMGTMRAEWSMSDQMVSPWRVVFSSISPAPRLLMVKLEPSIVPRSVTVASRRDSFCWAARRSDLSNCVTNWRVTVSVMKDS